MFNKLSIVTLFVIALSVTACGPIQLPASLTQFVGAIHESPLLPGALQALVSPSPTPTNTPDTSTTSPSTAPSSSAQNNRNQGNRAQAPAALAQIFHQLGWEAGVVTTAASDQIGLRTIRNGPDKIAIGASTIVIVPGNANAAVSDIHAGDRVIADIPKDASAASLVLDVPKGYDKNNVLLGMVQSNSNGSIALRTRGGSDTIATSSTTQVIQVIRQGVALGSVSDLQNGSLLLAVGQASGEDFTAQVIFALPKGALNLGKGLGSGRKNSTPPSSGG